MDRSNHYEAAFEAYLQHNGFSYVAVDEARRSWLGARRVKSVDFLVCGPFGGRFVLDIKGRRFPGGTKEKPRRVWENWSTEDDVDGLEGWAEQFGTGYAGLLVFSYHLLPSVEIAEETPDLFDFHGKRYLFRAIPIDQYRKHQRVRSPRWRTVSIPSPVFRSLVRPVQDFLLAEVGKDSFASEREASERWSRVDF